MPAARALSISAFSFGIASTQRGRSCVLQFVFMKSKRKSAVVLGSTVTAFNGGGGGSCRLGQSAMMSAARAPTAPSISVAPASKIAAAPRRTPFGISVMCSLPLLFFRIARRSRDVRDQSLRRGRRAHLGAGDEIDEGVAALGPFL